jgi:hypothetical protein
MGEGYSMVKEIYQLLLGVFIGALFAYINVLLVYRTGMSISAALVTPLLVFLLLRVLFKPTRQEVTRVQSIITGASMSVFCLDSAFASVVIFSSGINVSLPELIILGLGMNLFGILFSCFLIHDWVESGKLPFPKAVVVGEVINTLDSATKKNEYKQLGLSLVGSMLISGLTAIFPKIKNPFSLTNHFPVFIGFELSPLLFGLGMLLPFKTILLLLCGAGYSFLIWIFKLKMPSLLVYKQLLFDPFNFSVAMGLAFGSIIYSLVELVKNTLGEFLNNHSPNIDMSKLTSYFYFGLVFIFLCLLGQYGFMHISALLMIPVLIMGILFCFVSARLRAETGMGVSTPIFIAIPFIYWITPDFTTVLILSGGIILATVVAYSSLEAHYVGYLTQTPMKAITRMYTLGALVGTLIGCVSIFMLNKAVGLGTSTLPAPSALAWGTFAKAIASGGKVNCLILPLFIITIILGFLLSLNNISSILIAIGILMPVATPVTISLGYFVLKLFHKNISIPKISSGLIMGEGLVSMIEAIVKLF